MKKKILQALLIGMVTVSVTVYRSDNSYAQREQTNEEVKDPASVIFSETEATISYEEEWDTVIEAEISKEELKIFQKAVEGLEGVNYEPVRLLATQLVSGTNYAFLCQRTTVSPDATPEYCIVYVFENLEEKVEVLHIQKLVPTSEEAMVGGWTVIDHKDGNEASAAAAIALENAAVEQEGDRYEPILTLASQVVAGTNYLVLCKAVPAVSEPEGRYCLVTVYEDLEGNSEIISSKNLIYSVDEKDTAIQTGKVIERLKGITDVTNLSDGIYDVGFTENTDIFADEKGQVLIAMEMYETVRFDAVDIALMSVGDCLAIDGEEITVKMIEQTTNGIQVNGDESFTLVPADGGTYNMVGASDYVIRVKVGDVRLPIADKFRMTDSSNPEKEEQTAARDEFVRKAAESDKVYLPEDTTVRLEDGYIVELKHIYVP